MMEITNSIASHNELVLILLDIRSVQNTASLFRTADCSGVSKIYLVGTTPTPLDRFKRKRSDFSKVSLGAEESVRYEYVSDINMLLEKLNKEKYEIVALEQSGESIDYKEYSVKSKMALILGTEVSGVPQNILDMCDVILEIPMRGEKESLNVSIAGAVALFRILNI